MFMNRFSKNWWTQPITSSQRHHLIKTRIKIIGEINKRSKSKRGIQMMNTMKNVKMKKKIPMKILKKSLVNSVNQNIKKYQIYLRCSHRCTICVRIGSDNRGISNTWNKPVFFGINSQVATLTASTRGYVSSKNWKRKYGMKKSRDRHKKEIKTRSYSNSRCVKEKLRRRNSIRCTKLKWNRKIKMMSHQSFLQVHPKKETATAALRQLQPMSSRSLTSILRLKALENAKMNKMGDHQSQRKRYYNKQPLTFQ